MSAFVKYRLCLLFLLMTNLAGGQVVDKAILSSTVWITYEVATDQANRDPRSPRAIPAPVFGGTGFLLFRNLGYSRGQVYLVTNKHVLPPEGTPQSIKLRVVVHDRNGQAQVEGVTVPVVGQDGKYLNSVHLHPDRDTDVAAINIALTAFSSKFQVLTDALITGRCLNTSMLTTSEELRGLEIGIGAPVYLIGFPASLFDPRNVSPILRVGVIATDPREGFSFNNEMQQSMHFPPHVNGFLIDANVYPGSSGSLVILAGEGNKTTEPANKTSWQPKILGIVGGSIPVFDASLRSYERIGLGIVYSAETIREVIQSASE
jgi:hypothetical protein